MRNNKIKIAITVVGLIALWRLWGTPYQILWWSILVLIVLSWLAAQIVRIATRGKSEQDVARSLVWTNMGISIVCLILALVGIVLPYAVPPSTEQLKPKAATGLEDKTAESDDRKFCREAMISFIKARGMQWDDDGNKLQLMAQQEEQMKALIRTGIESAENVSDSFLDSIHPFLKDEFRDRLVQGWTIYLEGLDTHNEQTQAKGIRLLMEWEDFKVDFIDLFYETIIK